MAEQGAGGGEARGRSWMRSRGEGGGGHRNEAQMRIPQSNDQFAKCEHFANVSTWTRNGVMSMFLRFVSKV